MAEQYKGNSSWTPSQSTTVVVQPPPRSATHPLPEIPPSYSPSAGVVGADSNGDDLVYNLVRREVNDYQSLDRNPPPYTDSSGSGPSTSDTSPSPATVSPAQHSLAMRPVSDNTRPDPLSNPQKKPASPNQKSTRNNGDEIEELHSGKALHSAEGDKQNEAGGGVGEGTVVDESNIPNTNFAIACMVTFCFNLPLGILAMYFSLKAVRAFQDGRTKLGQKRSRWSILVSLLGIAFTTVLVSSIVLYIAMQGQKRISQYKAYSMKAGLSL
ncbi:uncharacterized protein LOC143292609 [Babylonia areolata]|uniref:uncharacterized protein LOC143292609 n=1 Tax=Babylonia areolata TaxID=304850 RepID=UPI003FD6A19F